MTALPWAGVVMVVRQSRHGEVAPRSTISVSPRALQRGTRAAERTVGPTLWRGRGPQLVARGLIQQPASRNAGPDLDRWGSTGGGRGRQLPRHLLERPIPGPAIALPVSQRE